MKDRLLDSNIDGILDSSKNRNSDRILGFASLNTIPEVSIEEYVVKTFQSTLKEVYKYSKRLESIITLIENFICPP